MKKEKSYIPNKNLELTPNAEIKRLLKVIEEKNALIDKFKRYDAKRNERVRRLEKNYELMEERFEEFNNAIEECDEIEDGTKDFYKSVVERIYKGLVSIDKAKSVLQVAHSSLSNLQESFDNLEFLIMDVGNVKKRSEMLDELRKMKTRYLNIASSFKKKIGELK